MALLFSRPGKRSRNTAAALPFVGGSAVGRVNRGLPAPRRGISLWRSSAWALVLSGLFALSGCATMDSAEPEFRGMEPGWGETMRSLTDPGELMGVSSRARQVERNLGVQ
jgi:hypothetical protein